MVGAIVAGGNGGSILLVEDEPRLRRTLARSLGGRRYQVEEAQTAAEAVAAATSRRFDLMLLDVNLPDASGWDVLRRLRAADLELPVVVLSAMPPSPSRLREFGPIGVLYKPFPLDALLRHVRLACDLPPPAGGAIPAAPGTKARFVPTDRPPRRIRRWEARHGVRR